MFFFLSKNKNNNNKQNKTKLVIHSLIYFTLKGFLQRNCTQEAYWSEPFPPYAVACGFDEGSSKGPEDQVSFYFLLVGISRAHSPEYTE